MARALNDACCPLEAGLISDTVGRLRREKHLTPTAMTLQVVDIIEWATLTALCMSSLRGCSNVWAASGRCSKTGDGPSSFGDATREQLESAAEAADELWTAERHGRGRYPPLPHALRGTCILCQDAECARSIIRAGCGPSRTNRQRAGELYISRCKSNSVGRVKAKHVDPAEMSVASSWQSQ